MGRKKVRLTIEMRQKSSKCKLHQPRVQHQGQEKVECNHQRHGPDGSEVFDLPVVRDQGAERANTSKHNHGKDHDEAEKEGELEPAQDGRHFVEERCAGGFLGCGSPGHVDGEHVASNGLGHVDGNAAQENREQR